MLRSTLVLALSLGFLGLAGTASALPIFPPLIGGSYTSTVVAAVQAVDVDGVPTEPATRSIAMVLSDGSQLACVPAAPGESVSVTYTVPNNAGRESAQAVAYSLDACVATADSAPSAPSDNKAFYFFVPPGKPALQ